MPTMPAGSQRENRRPRCWPQTFATIAQDCTHECAFTASPHVRMCAKRAEKNVTNHATIISSCANKQAARHTPSLAHPKHIPNQMQTQLSQTKRHIPPRLLSDNNVEMAVPALFGDAAVCITMVHVVTRLMLNPGRDEKISMTQTKKPNFNQKPAHSHTHAHAPMRNAMPAAAAKVRAQAKAR